MHLSEGIKAVVMVYRSVIGQLEVTWSLPSFSSVLQIYLCFLTTPNASHSTHPYAAAVLQILHFNQFFRDSNRGTIAPTTKLFLFSRILNWCLSCKYKTAELLQKTVIKSALAWIIPFCNSLYCKKDWCGSRAVCLIYDVVQWFNQMCPFPVCLATVRATKRWLESHAMCYLDIRRMQGGRQ